MSHIHELGLGTSLFSHETNSFVVQPYEPIPLIVLPYKLLICSKSSKPSRLGPWHARNHHTMDSSPNSSRREHHSSLPVVRPTHVIIILRTPHPIVVDRNSTSVMPIMRSTIQAHPKPLLDLVLQAQTSQTQAYTSYPLGNNKQTIQIVHKHMAIRLNSLKPRTLAQAKLSISLRLAHLAWASLK